MATDKAMMKTLFQTISVEFFLEEGTEFTLDHFKEKVDSASGSRYGKGRKASSTATKKTKK